VSPLSFVIMQVRFGRSDRRSAAWRLAGDLSPRRANFLQLVSRAMVWIGSRGGAEDHLEIRGLCIYKTSCNARAERIWRKVEHGCGYGRSGSTESRQGWTVSSRDAWMPS
jgi:hypothetical protein